MESAWERIGRIGRERRERLGLRQEELADYGGPRVSTVGKFERAVAHIPQRTQHAIEKSLGWSRGVIYDFAKGAQDGTLDAGALDQWEHDLVEDNIPDLTHTVTRNESEAIAELREEVDQLRRQVARLTGETG